MNETEKNPMDEALILEAEILAELPAATRTYSSMVLAQIRDTTFLDLQNKLLDLLLSFGPRYGYPTPSTDTEISPETWLTVRTARRKRLHGLATLNAHYIKEHYLAFTGCFETEDQGLPLPLSMRSQLLKVERMLASANKKQHDHTQRAAFWNAQEHLSNLLGVFGEELTEKQRTRVYDACVADYPGDLRS